MGVLAGWSWSWAGGRGGWDGGKEVAHGKGIVDCEVEVVYLEVASIQAVNLTGEGIRVDVQSDRACVVG